MRSVPGGEDRDAPVGDTREPHALGNDYAAATIRLQLTVRELLL